MVENLRRALHQRWLQGALCVWALVVLVALGALALDYSWIWVSAAAGPGGITSSLFVFRGLWINSAPARGLRATPDHRRGEESPMR